MLSFGNRKHAESSPWLPLESFTFVGLSPLLCLLAHTPKVELRFFMFLLIWSWTVHWDQLRAREGRDLILDYSQGFLSLLWVRCPMQTLHLVSFLEEFFWFLGAVTKLKKSGSWIFICGFEKTLHKNRSERGTYRGAWSWLAHLEKLPLQIWELARWKCSGGKFYFPKNNLFQFLWGSLQMFVKPARTTCFVLLVFVFLQKPVTWLFDQK